MKFGIEEDIFEKYPQTEIGFLIAQVNVKKSDPFVENIKQSLREELSNQGINATNFAAHPNIALWRKIYEKDFHVKPKNFRSSIEALLRRIVKGKEIWNICNIVDLYNCCSILSLLPMGGYDLNKISGDIVIRYAKEGEDFIGLGKKERIEAKHSHVVYADQKRIICWLWNYKDAQETCIDENTKDVVFFVDAFSHTQAKRAIEQLTCTLEKINGTPSKTGILNRASPSTNLF